MIEGTPGDDGIVLEQFGMDYSATVNGATSTRSVVGVSIVTINGLAGNDTISISGSVFSGVTILGGDGDDHITGGNSGDEIHGGNGADWIAGMNGMDSIFGDGANDSVYGGPGVDSIQLGDGNDLCYSGRDNDTIWGNLGNDTIVGDNNDDWLSGDAGLDVLNGGNGSDSIYGGAGTDQLIGSSGNDVVRGGADADRIYGGYDQDNLSGDAGNDTIHGGLGNDALSGQEGNDLIYGEDGDDTIAVRDTGALLYRDTVFGGDGNDGIDWDTNDRVFHDQLAGIDFMDLAGYNQSSADKRYYASLTLDGQASTNVAEVFVDGNPESTSVPWHISYSDGTYPDNDPYSFSGTDGDFSGMKEMVLEDGANGIYLRGVDVEALGGYWVSNPIPNLRIAPAMMTGSFSASAPISFELDTTAMATGTINTTTELLGGMSRVTVRGTTYDAYTVRFTLQTNVSVSGSMGGHGISGTVSETDVFTFHVSPDAGVVRITTSHQGAGSVSGFGSERFNNRITLDVMDLPLI